ncbi:MAG: hypothetical protein ABF876_02155 [Acetobacter aceti]|nr:hypothetical protein [Acetobacter aceti]
MDAIAGRAIRNVGVAPGRGAYEKKRSTRWLQWGGWRSQPVSTSHFWPGSACLLCRGNYRRAPYAPLMALVPCWCCCKQREPGYGATGDGLAGTV